MMHSPTDTNYLLSDAIRKLFLVPSGLLGIIPRRVTFVVDKQAKMILIFDNSINVTKHAQKAIESIKKNSITKQ